MPALCLGAARGLSDCVTAVAAASCSTAAYCCALGRSEILSCRASSRGFNEHRQHHVSYEDGQEEWLVLTDERFTWLGPRAQSAGCTPAMRVGHLLRSSCKPPVEQPLLASSPVQGCCQRVALPSRAAGHPLALPSSGAQASCLHWTLRAVLLGRTTSWTSAAKGWCTAAALLSTNRCRQTALLPVAGKSPSTSWARTPLSRARCVPAGPKLRCCLAAAAQQLALLY